ncbi:TIGR03826 family flagellar region protein [Paenibacillus sacheonensis]|uniref:Flagellar protein n=1 Tax=Paenibacillus sacheonensis TaxID=742054 RepID=A0A7X4YV50_9BACL|nr:TIGR03826 family flagellar region protein [Paenibacillus sacheonensis]MBM7566483.1 flagellar operon protein (TIGR03826 family) [Paenibacillus sacheonensis]NBC73166.1 flagellar protein [Paenibacillus sacheonensis]
MNLDNCPRCGKLFAKNFRDVCPACIKAIDNEYALCSDYLRKQKSANITELSEATDVSIKQITKFIKEGRISLMGAPNLMYPCEMCGTLIREHNQCESCRAKLLHEVNKVRPDIAAKENEDKAPTSAASVYRIMDRKRY